MKKIAVAIYGPPGSGKGTQADLLSKQLNLIHFDAGAYIDEVVHDPKNRGNKMIQRQRRAFDSGALCDPLWVARLAVKRVRELAEAGYGIVLSGSMRKVMETFGNNKQAGLLEALEKGYGRKNLFFFLIKVQPQTSLKRNSARLVCAICGKPVLTQYMSGRPKGCPVCGGPLRKRTLDDPDVIKERLAVYKRDTNPIFKLLRKRGYKLRAINGGQAPYIVNKEILNKLNHVFN